METAQNLMSSPGIAQLLLFVLFVEATALLLLWRFLGKGLPPAQTLSFLGAGAAFSVALLVVLSGGSTSLLAGALILAFLSHVMDIWLRWTS